MSQGAAPEKFVGEFASTLHDRTQHVIVVPACEQDFAGIELEEGATDGPHVNPIIVWYS